MDTETLGRYHGQPIDIYSKNVEKYPILGGTVYTQKVLPDRALLGGYRAPQTVPRANQ